MNEQLLQFIWQFQYFNKTVLITEDGEPIQIIHQGTINTNQGPDFLNAKIKIGTTLWAGSVELHLKTSDWHKHKHTSDVNYKNVILHVVYENDESNGPLPVLELITRISHTLLSRYTQLMLSQTFIPCENMVHTVPAITVSLWKDRLIAERLTHKSGLALQYLRQNRQHWEESFWWLLAKNFGGKINGEVFEAIAKSISIKILAKHKNRLQQIEA